MNGWLEKNKDPVNDSVVEQLRKGGNKLMNELFEDNNEAEVSSTKAKRAKGSTFQTVSALYREQVGNLMETLNKTSPHFIRCIIPNEDKEAGKSVNFKNDSKLCDCSPIIAFYFRRH